MSTNKRNKYPWWILVALIATIFATIYATTFHPVTKRKQMSATCISDNAIVTEDGNEWGIEDNPAIRKGNAIEVIFDTKGTTNVTDDEIVEVWSVN